MEDDRLEAVAAVAGQLHFGRYIEQLQEGTSRQTTENVESPVIRGWVRDYLLPLIFREHLLGEVEVGTITAIRCVP
jgi:hypothetical protein